MDNITFPAYAMVYDRCTKVCIVSYVPLKIVSYVPLKIVSYVPLKTSLNWWWLAHGTQKCGVLGSSHHQLRFIFQCLLHSKLPNGHWHFSHVLGLTIQWLCHAQPSLPFKIFFKIQQLIFHNYYSNQCKINNKVCQLVMNNRPFGDTWVWGQLDIVHLKCKYIPNTRTQLSKQLY